MNRTLRNSCLFFIIYTFALYSYAVMQVTLFQQQTGNSFQQVARGEIDSHVQSGASTYLTPITNGPVIQAPECDEDQMFEWDVFGHDNPESSDQSESLPTVRLCRSGQPVIDIFFMVSMYHSGQVVRTVRFNNAIYPEPYSVIDGHWVNQARNWDFTSPLLQFHIRHRPQTPLSRFIYQLLLGISLTSLPGQNVYDDIFFTTYDSSIYLCIVTQGGKKRVVVKIIRSGFPILMAIFDLPDGASLTSLRRRPSSIDGPLSRLTGGLFKRRSSQGNIPHQLQQARKSSPAPKESPSSSPKHNAANQSNNTYVLERAIGFTLFEAFLIISASQLQKYTR